jgi:hypothetical protein
MTLFPWFVCVSGNRAKISGLNANPSPRRSGAGDHAVHHLLNRAMVIPATGLCLSGDFLLYTLWPVLEELRTV